MRGLHAPSGAYRTRMRISKTPAFISKCCKALYRSDPPSSTETQAFRSPFPNGEGFWLGSFQVFQPSPGGKGDREERAVDEGSFRLSYASLLRNTIVTTFTQSRNCLAGGSQTVAERSRPSGEWSGRRRTGGLSPPREFLGVA